VADVRLVFDNAMTFNPKDHWVYSMALSLVVFSSFQDSPVACAYFVAIETV
jgi:hypothetical protein